MKESQYEKHKRMMLRQDKAIIKKIREEMDLEIEKLFDLYLTRKI